MNDTAQIFKRSRMNMHKECKGHNGHNERNGNNNRCKEKRTRQYFTEKKKHERRKATKPSHRIPKCAIRTLCSDSVEYKEELEYDIEESSFGLYMYRFACEFEYDPSAAEDRAHAKMYTHRCKMTYI